MEFPAQLYKTGLLRRAGLLALPFFLTLASGAAVANETTKPAAKPVARLLSGSRMEIPPRVRLRQVAAYRALPSAAAASRASAAVVAATSSESRLLGMINEERRARGRRPLVWDAELTRMARYHSENMARQEFFNHLDRDGLDLTARAELLGLRGWKVLAENIAYNQGFDDPEAFAVERWMISAKHRDNILNGEFTHAGLGVARGSDGRVYFTQVFMKR